LKAGRVEDGSGIGRTMWRGDIKAPLEGEEAYRASAIAKEMGRIVHLLKLKERRATVDQSQGAVSLKGTLSRVERAERGVSDVGEG